MPIGAFFHFVCVCIVKIHEFVCASAVGSQEVFAILKNVSLLAKLQRNEAARQLENHLSHADSSFQQKDDHFKRVKAWLDGVTRNEQSMLQTGSIGQVCDSLK